MIHTIHAQIAVRARLLWAFVISQALYSPKARLMRAITVLRYDDVQFSYLQQ